MCYNLAMVVKITTATLIGLDAYKIDVEVDVLNSLPQVSIIGLGDTAISEAKERLRLAIKNSSYDFPQTKVVINLAPADLKKEGTSYDLAMAVGILAKENIIKNIPNNTAFLGELSLDGSIRPISGILPIVCALSELGVKRVILPYQNLKEASFVEGIESLGAKNLNELVNFLNNEGNLHALTQKIDDFLSNPKSIRPDDIIVIGELDTTIYKKRYIPITIIEELNIDDLLSVFSLGGK